MQITSGKEDGSPGLFWTPDSKIVYATRGAAQGETWITTVDGSNKKTDGRSIAYVNTIADVSNFWAQPINGGLPKRLTDFKSNQIFHFAWSIDGRQLALSRGFVTTDVVLVGDFR